MKKPSKEKYGKLTGEARDLALFDLMEGNLPEKEAEALLQAIENDDEFAEEFAALQSTRLPEETIVYGNKKSLLKKESTPILLFTSWRSGLTIAAAIIAMVVLAFPLFEMFKDVPIEEAASSLIESSESSSEESLATLPKEQQEAIVITAVEEPNPMDSEEYHHQKSQTESSKLPLNPVSDKGTVVVIEDQIPIDVNVPDIAYMDYFDNEPLFIDAIDLPLSDMPNALQQPVVNVIGSVDFGYRGLRGTMNHGLAMAAAPFRNPRIKIRNNKDKKDPGLKIEVSTDQYYAVAMVHLFSRNSR